MLAAYQIINKILQTKDISIVKRNGLDSSYFKGYEKEFNFIVDHFKQYGNVPDQLTFVGKFPDTELLEVNETEDYLLDRLYDDYGFEKFAVLLPHLKELAKQDSRVAYNYLISEMANLKPHAVCKGIDIIANARERYDKFKDRANDPDKMIIKTGLPELDAILGGWEYGDELVTIVGRTNAGKSWILLKFLTEAWKQGKKVGLYSGEMSHIKLGYRFDSMFSHFSNRALVQGIPVDGYKEYIDSMIGLPNPFIIIQQKEFGGRPTVQKIRNFIEENEIEIMGIDQYSLMEDGRAGMRDPTRIRMAHIAEDLFLLSSEYKIPILGLAQANREATKKENDMDAPGIENIKESDDIAANSSKCIGIKQSNFGLILDIIKNREGRVGDKLLYNWSIDDSSFTYIPSENDAAPAPIRQQVAHQTKQTFTPNVSDNPF